MSANQNEGIEMPRNVRGVATLSKTLPLRMAQKIPTGMEMQSAMRKDTPQSCRVGTTRSPMSSSTGRELLIDTPQSPVSMPASQCRYWMGTGSFRPCASLIASMASSEAFGFSRYMSSGSPGIACSKA